MDMAKVAVSWPQIARGIVSMSPKEYSEDADDGRTDFTPDMEKAANSRPTFKTAWEFAFETANTLATQ